MTRSHPMAPALVLCLLATWAVAAGQEPATPAELVAQIRAPVSLGRAVSLRGVELEMGPAIFEVQRGVLFPVRNLEGRTVELVFIGQASFRLDPPDKIEAGQLELFTGERFLEAPVEEAVLVLANERAVEELLAREDAADLRPELVERANAIHRDWLQRPERRIAGIESAMFKMLIGDQAFQQFFALWAHSFELGRFLFQLDPEEQEQITLASFRPLEMTHWERLRWKHQIRVQQRKGRWLDVRVEDLGSWDVWFSQAWLPSEGPLLAGTVGFETEHYELDVKLNKRRLRLEGRAALQLTAESEGRRVVRVELMKDLEVSAVRDGRGGDLFFFRAGEELAVLLPQETEAGQRLRIEIDYEGHALEWVSGRSFDLLDSSLWYPHCGTIDRATYDVTLRWPKKFDLLASGRLEESGQEGRYAWQRRRLDRPSIAFSFAVGDYVIDTVQSGQTEITVALSNEPKVQMSRELRQRTLAAVRDAFEYFESVFGDYPLDYLTVATAPRRFSQSYLGFITLAVSTIKAPDPLSRSAVWNRNTTIAHELAHQWWGNSVGWASYRDLWLSEGMANYAALLYDGRASGDSDRLAMMSAGWRDSLTTTTLEGRTLESLGPVVLGNRLNSSRARNGYRTIVYRKGAVVLAMLARAVGEEQFLSMLRSLSDAAQYRVLTTESFLKAIERMSGLDLDGFASQYVYGTGIPEVFYEYDLDRNDSGEWSVRGEARLLFAPSYRYEVVREDGLWDVRRRIWRRPDSGPATLMVPYRVTLESREEVAAAAREERLRQDGQVVLQGYEDGFEIATRDRPVELRLDPRGEILAWFYSAKAHPKRFAQYEGDDLAAAGALESAERRYLDALESPAETGPRDPLASRQRGIEGRVQDLKIRLALTRLYLEQGRTELAQQALDGIEREMEGWDRRMFRMQRDALRSRLEILRGEYEPAFRRLKKTLRIASPRKVRVPWRNLMLQLQLNTERDAVTEAYALLAIAAHETGNPQVFDWAVREARDRSVDLSRLLPFEPPGIDD